MADPKNPVWDVAQYERYKTYRDRPALDLLLQIPGGLDPAEVWDLGCGTGEHAAVLAARHPGARVHGLDSSDAMLAAARKRPAKVDWVLAEIGDFAPAIAPDLIFTNAALQWLPDHGRLFPRLVSELASGGVFACQIPSGGDDVWRTALTEVVGKGPWAERLAGVRGVYPAAAPEDYHRWLGPLCSEVDIWTTTYLHVLEGEDPVIDWMSGTALRPYLQALTDPAEREAFLGAYRARLAVVFPAQPDGTTLFPFPRLFMVARRA